MRELIRGIREHKEVFVTTNGYFLTAIYAKNVLAGIKGLNVSIHHHDISRNCEITQGYPLSQNTLEDAIVECRRQGISVRFNCNIMRGQIDSEKKVHQYIQWARERGVDRIRFAELKGDKKAFVSLAKIFGGKHGLNENPFVLGCNQNTVIDGMPVNFRQMCGLQTQCRPRPANAKNVNEKVVLYYDGNYYDGWQSQRR